jgi:hypothetical protein
MLSEASRPKAGQIGLAFPWQKHTSNTCKYIVPSFVFKEGESDLVFFGYKQKVACVLI